MAFGDFRWFLRTYTNYKMFLLHQKMVGSQPQMHISVRGSKDILADEDIADESGDILIGDILIYFKPL